MESAANEVAHDFSPYFRIYKDGSVVRMAGTEIVPPSPSPDPATGVCSRDIDISPENGVSARLFLPALPDPSSRVPLLFYVHGGAFCIETPFSPLYHAHLTAVASEARVVAVSIHYRRAPEHPLPAAYEDAWTALQWVASHAADGPSPDPWLRDHADLGRVFLAGDSAGANIAHNVAMRAGTQCPPGLKIAGMVLVHPFFHNDEPSRLMDCIFPTCAKMGDPRMNPAKDPNLARLALGCKRVLVLVAGEDFLKDRAWTYHDALTKSGWDGAVEVMEAQGENHVFHLFNPKCDNAAALMARFASFLKQE